MIKVCPKLCGGGGGQKEARWLEKLRCSKKKWGSAFPFRPHRFFFPPCGSCAQFFLCTVLSFKFFPAIVLPFLLLSFHFPFPFPFLFCFTKRFRLDGIRWSSPVPWTAMSQTPIEHSASTPSLGKGFSFNWPFCTTSACPMSSSAVTGQKWLTRKLAHIHRSGRGKIYFKLRQFGVGLDVSYI